MPRPKHPDSDLEKLLRSLEKQDWRVIRGKRYYKTYCPCPQRHKKTIHITPNNRYTMDVTKELARRTCWRQEER